MHQIGNGSLPSLFAQFVFDERSESGNQQRIQFYANVHSLTFHQI